MQTFNLLCMLRKDLCFHCKGRQLLPGLPENKFMFSGAVSYIEPNFNNLSPKSFQSPNFSQHFHCLWISVSLRNLPNALEISAGIAELLLTEWVHVHNFGNLQCKLPFFRKCNSVFLPVKIASFRFSVSVFPEILWINSISPYRAPNSQEESCLPEAWVKYFSSLLKMSSN